MSDVMLNRLLDLLPAIYREDPWLAGFLRPFALVIEDFERILAEQDRYLIPENRQEPAYRTDADFLPWLAGWLALELDEGWDEQKRRENIGKAVELYRRRGTVAGLKEYLAIYTGFQPEIREWVWPAGMQIGVASMIGGFAPEVDFTSYSAERQHLSWHDYYLVTETGDGGSEYYYRAESVERVDVDLAGGRVTLLYRAPDDHVLTQRIHQPAAVTRRDGLAETGYLFAGVPLGGTGEETARYQGDTVLVEEEGEIPYRFIVDVTVPAELQKSVRVEKIKAIIDLEKPAHTLYYLRLIPEKSGARLDPLQIELRSTIELDTLVG
jgi:phage tail-like protein